MPLKGAFCRLVALPGATTNMGKATAKPAAHKILALLFKSKTPLEFCMIV
jgi:hypothetical protein